MCRIMCKSRDSGCLIFLFSLHFELYAKPQGNVFGFTRLQMTPQKRNVKLIITHCYGNNLRNVF